MTEKLLTVLEAAEVLKVKKNTVYDMIKRGDLKASKLGKQLRIRQIDLEEYIRYGNRKPEMEEKNQYDHIPNEISAEKMIICGQDLVLDLLVDRLGHHPEGCLALRSFKGSYNGLYAMYQGQVDVATAHLWHGATDSYNLPYIGSMLPGTDVVVIHLLKRNQGFYVRKGNPKQITSFLDLRRKEITIVNREPGSGSRVLLDEKLRQNRMVPTEVRGYDSIVHSHLEAALAVAGERADVALGTERHSRQVSGIDFIFQQEESYDMVIRKEDFPKRKYQVLMEILQSEEYQKEVKDLGGYNITDMGKILYMD